MLKNPERRPVDFSIPEKRTFANPVLWTFYFPLDNFRHTFPFGGQQNHLATRSHICTLGSAVLFFKVLLLSIR